MTVEERAYIAKLRLRALNGETLAEADEAKVALFVHQVEAEEAERLAPALSQYEQKITAEGERQQRLMELLEREKAVYAQLQKIIEEIQSIDSERKILVRVVSA